MAEVASYKSVLKATSLLGGSSAFRIIMEMVRRKFVAVLLGPSGVGLMEIYLNIQNIIGTLAGMGLSISGVRQIAAVYGTGDLEKTAKLVKILRIVVWGLGCAAFIVQVVLSSFISGVTFKSREYAFSIAFLGLMSLLTSLTIGQTCIIQGCRRVGSVATMTLIGAVNGTIISIPCFYFWGTKGIVPSLLLVTFVSFITNWFFARKVKLPRARVSKREFGSETVNLLKMGIPIMASGLVAALVAYLSRLILIRQFELEGVGYWSAAYIFSAGLVSFILGAMAADYYPRLSAVSANKGKIAETLNVQTEIALYLSLPALVATILFAPFAIIVFYDSTFAASVPILEWSVYGILGRVVGWPMGYVLLAQARGFVFLVTETVSGFMSLLALWIMTICFGLSGAGVAYFINYVFYVCMMFVVLRISCISIWNKKIFLLLFVGFFVILSGQIISHIGYCLLRYALSGVLLSIVSVAMLYRLQRVADIRALAFINKLPWKKG